MEIDKTEDEGVEITGAGFLAAPVRPGVNRGGPSATSQPRLSESTGGCCGRPMECAGTSGAFGMPNIRLIRHLNKKRPGDAATNASLWRRQTADHGFCEGIKSINKDGRPTWEFRSIRGGSRLSW
jgi:hypothetical protein